MKYRLSKLTCILALFAASLSLSAAAATGGEVDIWVSKLFTMPTPTTATTDAGFTVNVKDPGVPSGVSCQLAAALYDGDGRMLDMKLLASNTTEDYTFTFTSATGAKTVKVFMFANDGLKPIYEAASKTLS